MEYQYQYINYGHRLRMAVIHPDTHVIKWEAQYPSFVQDAVTSEMIEDPTIFELGVMNNVEDVNGLEQYLITQHILDDGDCLYYVASDAYMVASENFAKGGQTGFDKLSGKIAKNLIGKSVPKKYQKKYGKTYDKADAKEAGKNIAGSIVNEHTKEDKPEKVIPKEETASVNIVAPTLAYESLSKEFENKYGIAPITIWKEIQDHLERYPVIDTTEKYGRLSSLYINFFKALHEPLHVTIPSDVHEESFYAQWQVALLEEGIDTGAKIESRDIEEGGQIHLQHQAKPLPPKKTKVEDSFKGVVATDDLRPAMMGVYYNVDRQELAATNAHILAVLPYKVTGKNRIINIGKPFSVNESSGKVTGIKTGDEIDARYPDYHVVVPEDNFLIYKNIDAHKLYEQVNAVIKANSKFKKYNADDEPIILSFDTPILSYFFSPVFFKGILDFFFKNGIGHVDICFSTFANSWSMTSLEESNIGNRGVIIRSATNEKMFALLMPITGAVMDKYFMNLGFMGVPTVDQRYKDYFAKKPDRLEAIAKIEHAYSKGGVVSESDVVFVKGRAEIKQGRKIVAIIFDRAVFFPEHKIPGKYSHPYSIEIPKVGFRECDSLQECIEKINEYKPDHYAEGGTTEGTQPQHQYTLSEDGNSLWIFGMGTLHADKKIANKDKDQIVREYMKEYEFFGKKWYIRQSQQAVKTAQRSGYIANN